MLTLIQEVNHEGETSSAWQKSYDEKRSFRHNNHPGGDSSLT